MNVVITRAVPSAVMNAAIYCGGILANPRGGSTSYGYRPAQPGTLAAIAAMADDRVRSLPPELQDRPIVRKPVALAALKRAVAMARTGIRSVN